MLEIIATVCVIAHPFKRTEIRLPLQAQIAHPAMCGLAAQAEAAAWVLDKPGYVIRDLRCVRSNYAAKE